MDNQTSAREHMARRARQISFADRSHYLEALKETELHLLLRDLFATIFTDSVVEITHGIGEFGGDLVVATRDPVRETVAAVVVKRGDLKGDTGGAASDILEQVRDCILIPRSLKSRIDNPKTTEVWLVLAGNMSDGFKTKMTSEVRAQFGTPVVVRTIDWLVDSFTTYRPEVFLGGTVMTFIQRRIDELESEATLTTRTSKLNLSEWFIEPRLATSRVPVELENAAQRLAVRSKHVALSDIPDLLQKQGRLIISGDPGVGKTTAMKKLALDLFKQASHAAIAGQLGRVRVPLLVTAQHLLEYQDCQALRAASAAQGSLDEDVEISVLMVDGLDEVPTNSRQEVIERASRFCADAECRLIVSSRKVEITKNPPPGIMICDLLPLQVNQAIALFEKLVRDSKLLLALRNGLAQIEGQLPMTPLSLVLLIEIAEDEGEVPASLCDLYSRYFEIMLGKWDLRDKGVQLLFKFETKWHFLSQLAWHVFRLNETFEVERAVLDAFIDQYVATYGLGRESIHQFIAEIERAGILEMGEVVGFRHRSFLDYFVAAYLLKNPSLFPDIESTIVQLYLSDMWSDVAFFYVGMTNTASLRLLDLVQASPGSDFSAVANRFLVGRLLQAGWMSPHDVKVHGIQAAMSNLPELRILLNQSFQESAHEVGLFADFLLMLASGWSLGSITLREALVDCMGRQLQGRQPDDIWKSMALAWAAERYSDAVQRKGILDDLLAAMAVCEPLTPEDRTRMLLLMIIAEREDRSLRSGLERRLRHIGKQHPALIRKLLPAPKEGFRPEDARRRQRGHRRT